jgi:hypothetical protein
MFADFSWSRKPTSRRGTGAAVVGVQRALSLLSTHSLPCSYGHTPLENAVMDGHMDVVAYLRRIGSPPLSFRLRVCVCIGACFQ